MQDAYFGPMVHGAEIMARHRMKGSPNTFEWIGQKFTVKQNNRVHDTKDAPEKCEALLKKLVNLSFADFYCADISAASFKMCQMNDSNFYQCRCHNTTFRGADLRGANFYEADLLGAIFRDAYLTGAQFYGARNIPNEVALCLIDGVYPESALGDSKRGTFDPKLVAKPAVDMDEKGRRRSIFISRPGTLSRCEQHFLDHILRAVRLRGFDIEQLTRSDYVNFGVLAELRRRISGTDGMIILGIPQIEITEGKWRGGHKEEKEIVNQALATPWNSIEAGMGVMVGLPTLIICDSRLSHPNPPGPAGLFSLEAQAEENLFGPMEYDGHSVLNNLNLVEKDGEGDKLDAIADTFRVELNMDNKHFNEWAACVKQTQHTVDTEATNTKLFSPV